MAKMGRPTKITPALIEDARTYMTEHDITVGTLLPTIEGLAFRLNIRRDTLYEWEKTNQDFSDILEDIRQLQANKLIQNSIVNRYNPTIAKMMLSKYGYVEKTEREVKVEEVKPILGGLSKDVPTDDSDKETSES